MTNALITKDTFPFFVLTKMLNKRCKIRFPTPFKVHEPLSSMQEIEYTVILALSIYKYNVYK